MSTQETVPSWATVRDRIEALVSHHSSYNRVDNYGDLIVTLCADENDTWINTANVIVREDRTTSLELLVTKYDKVDVFTEISTIFEKITKIATGADLCQSCHKPTSSFAVCGECMEWITENEAKMRG